MAHYIPEGHTAITPYLVIKGARQALEFYTKAFGAKELFKNDMGTRINHAEMLIGGARFMLADEHPEMGIHAPQGSSPVLMLLYVEDVDAVFQRALQLGAKQERAVETHFYGDRSGTLVDPFGHRWTIGTHVEDVSPQELERRMKAAR